jgi:hypothetical protein
MRERRRSEERGAHDVGAERPHPRRGVDVLDAAQDADAGRVDDGIDAAEAGDDLLHRAGTRVRIGHVTRDRERPGTGLGRGVVQQVLAPCEQCDLRTASCQPDADAATEPGRRADDDGSHAVRSSASGAGCRDARSAR